MANEQVLKKPEADPTLFSSFQPRLILKQEEGFDCIR
jgi:hypothetical protein